MKMSIGCSGLARALLGGITAALFLSGCGSFFVKKPTEDKNPLLATECPVELQPVADDTFGSTVKAAIAWANQYHNCRRAALTGTGK